MSVTKENPEDKQWHNSNSVWMVGRKYPRFYSLCMCAQSCPILWCHGLYSPASSLGGIFQARILEWIAISYHPGINSMSLASPALAGRFFTTAPPGKLNFHSSVQFSCSVMSNSLWPHGLQHAMLPSPSPTPRVYSNSCPLSRWCHPTISSSVIPFSSHLQSFPALGSFQMSQLFASGAQSIRVSASAQSFQWIFRTNFL